jgi:hypothetical protein
VTYFDHKLGVASYQPHRRSNFLPAPHQYFSPPRALVPSALPISSTSIFLSSVLFRPVPPPHTPPAQLKDNKHRQNDALLQSGTPPLSMGILRSRSLRYANGSFLRHYSCAFGDDAPYGLVLTLSLQVFLLLVTEMLIFCALIVPLPFTWRRKLFTFVSESSLVARLQYGMKVQRPTFGRPTFV